MRNSAFTRNFHSPLESSSLATNLPLATSKLSVCTVKTLFLWRQRIIKDFFLGLMKAWWNGKCYSVCTVHKGIKVTFLLLKMTLVSFFVFVLIALVGIVAFKLVL